MRILKCIWKKQFIEKLEQKHHVAKDEVQEVFDNNPRFNFIAKGHVKGEDSIALSGRLTPGGIWRYSLFISAWDKPWLSRLAT